jgi:hypothetical protein
VALPEYGPTVVVENPDAVLTRLARVKAALAEHGLSVHPSSRLARLERAHELFAAKRLGPASGPSRELFDLLEGSRDFAELALIVEQLLPTTDAQVLRKLRLALGGGSLPGEDAKSLARDTQFELYVAAQCRRAGIPTAIREPPDSVITSAGVQLGVAAKRVKTATQVPKRVREGGHQLKRAGLVGIAALSLDQLVPPDDERVAGRTVEELKPLPRDLIHAIVSKHRVAITAAAAGTPVLAVRASLVVVAAVPGENRIGRVSGNYLFAVRRLTRKQHGALLHLVQALGRSVPP